MPAIGSVNVRVSASTIDLRSGLQRAASAVSDFASAIPPRLNTAAAAVNNFGKSAKTAFSDAATRTKPAALAMAELGSIAKTALTPAAKAFANFDIVKGFLEPFQMIGSDLKSRLDAATPVVTKSVTKLKGRVQSGLSSLSAGVKSNATTLAKGLAEPFQMIGADIASRLKPAGAALSAFGARTAKRLQPGVDAALKFTAPFRRFGGELAKMGGPLKTIGSVIGGEFAGAARVASGVLGKGLAGAARLSVAAMKPLGAATLSAGGAIAKLGLKTAVSGMGAARGAVSKLGAAFGSLGSMATQGIGSVVGSVSSMGSSLAGLAMRFGPVAAGIAAVTAAMAGLKVGIGGAVALEQSAVAFEVLLGDAGKAKVMLGELQDYATKSPFTIKGVNESAQQLMNYGIAGDKILPTIKMLGDVAAGDADKMQRLGTAFGQMSATGRLMGQDLLQFVNAGFNPLQEISKKTGESMVRLKKRMEAGGIASSEVEAAFQAATGAGGRFYGMTEKQSKSLGGLWNSLTENITIALRDVSVVLLDAFDVKGSMSAMITFTQSIADRVKSLTPIIQTVASVFSSAWNLITIGASALFNGLAKSSAFSFGSVVESVKSVGDWIKSTFESIAPIVSAAGTTLAAYWTLIANGAMVAFNYVTTTLSSLFGNISTIFGEITGIAGMTFSDVGMFILDALILGEFLFNNFSEVALFAFENVKLGAVTLFNDIGHFFTGVIPAWFTWFGKNWSDVFFSAFDLATTIFINLGQNIRNMFSSLWNWIKSGFTTSFEIDWTPLTQGAVNAVKSLPEIPARAVTELEQNLKNNVGKMGDSLGDKLGEHMNKRRDELLGKPPEMPKRVNVTGALATAGAATMPGMTSPVSTAAKKPLEAVAGLNRSSSDAFSAVFKAQRGEPIQDKILKTNEKQLAETKQVRKNLDKMTNGDGIQWVAGEVIV